MRITSLTLITIAFIPINPYLISYIFRTRDIRNLFRNLFVIIAKKTSLVVLVKELVLRIVEALIPKGSKLLTLIKTSLVVLVKESILKEDLLVLVGTFIPIERIERIP